MQARAIGTANANKRRRDRVAELVSPERSRPNSTDFNLAPRMSRAMSSSPVLTSVMERAAYCSLTGGTAAEGGPVADEEVQAARLLGVVADGGARADSSAQGRTCAA